MIGIISAWQFYTKGKVMDSKCSKLDVAAEMGSKASGDVRWNVSILPTLKYLHI